MTEQREPVEQPVTEPGQDAGMRWAPEETVVTEPTPADPRRPVIPESTDQVDGPEAVDVGEDTPVLRHDEPDTVVSPAEQLPAAPGPDPVPVPQTAVEPAPLAQPAPEPDHPAPAQEWVPVSTTAPEPKVRTAPSPVSFVPEPVEPALQPDPTPTAETMALPGTAIFRDSPAAQESTVAEPRSEEAEKLAAERAARKEAREAALAASAPVAVAAPEPVIVHTRTNDKFLGSFGLFALRLVVGAIFTVRGIHLLSNLVEVQEQFAQTIIPYPQVAAIVTGIAHLLIALALVLGLLTRVAGLGIVLIAGGVLAFVLWGPWNIFLTPVPGQSGAFLGEFELLLAAVGLLFLLIGGGGWSLDRSFRTARAKDKAERQIAA